MVEKTEKIAEKSIPVEIDMLDLAEKSQKENDIPIYLFEEEDEMKEYIFEFVSFESERVIFCNMKKNQKKMLVRVNIRPNSAYTQFQKLEIKPKDIFSVKYLGKKDQDSGFTYKAFVLKKFDIALKKFLTTKQI